MQYPTIGQPQYAFGPGLAPVPMPGMARGGLAALASQYRKGGRIRYFENGGDTGDSGATGGADSSTEGGAGAAFGGDPGPGPSSGDPGAGGSGVDAGAAAQAAAQGVDNAVDAMADMQAAAEATLGAQVAAEADEAEATQAAETMANLQSIAAEISNQAEENAKTEAMAAVMSGKVEGFPGPSQEAPGFSFNLVNPISMNKPLLGVFDPAVTIGTPVGKASFSIADFAAPAMGKAAQAVNTGVNVGRAMGFAEGGLAAATGGTGIGSNGASDSYKYGGRVMNYAQGGEAYGRGGDSMLVHMNPREVAGLQALARSNGTSMTINPNTGYPEAFNLKALLPALIGLGLNAFAPGVGSAVGQALGTSSAVGTGVAVGGATALGTGSLKKGIMAGLGAYGGAGLGEGLAGSSGLAGTPETIAQGSPMLSNPPPTPLDAALQTKPIPGMESSLQGGMTPSNIIQPNVNLAQGFGGAPLPSGNPVVPTATPATYTPNVDISAATVPQTGLTTGQAFKYGSAALTPALQPEPFEPPKSNAMIRPYDFEYNPQTGAYDRPAGDTSEAAYFSPTFTARDPYLAAAGGGLMDSMRSVDFDKEDNYYAAGGLTAFKQGGRPKSRPLVGEDYYKFMGRDDTMLGTAEKNFAGGGTPRFLSGGGDGMSDDIPAVIGDKQPARLADGEFVIPADVVSHLGNGSSKAGAKRLYEMMADIRKERTGTKKQAPAIKPSKFMPA